MSTNLAQAWVDRAVRSPTVRRSLNRCFDDAMRQRATATIMVGRGLTRQKKSWLARQMSDEFVVLELSRNQQQALDLGVNETITGMSAANSTSAPLNARPLTLTDVQFDARDAFHLRENLTGCCQIQMSLSLAADPLQLALRGDYFHPCRDDDVTGCWHPVAPIFPHDQVLRFSLPPWQMEGEESPQVAIGFLFLQIVAVEDRTNMQYCWPISNVVAKAIHLTAE